MKKTVVVIGGGAGGFFAAINIKEKNPSFDVSILEQSNTLLKKVKISGGGRCNVTHACFEPKKLASNYPRGEKELRQAFYQFQPKDMIAWLKTRGVHTKTEADGRMFPISDSSQTIIDCFLNESKKLGVKILTQHAVDKLTPPSENDSKWKIFVRHRATLEADVVVVATGSSPKSFDWIKSLGHTITPLVPSLFTVNIKNDERLKDMAGVAVSNGTVWANKTKLAKEKGAVLITHWGLSAPAVLRLSAWGARVLADLDYHFELRVSWLDLSKHDAIKILKQKREEWKKKQVSTQSPFDIPARLWKKIVEASQLSPQKRWAELGNKHIEKLAQELTEAAFQVSGKSTFKDEFVTCGGVALSEINFKTMQSKIHPNLYFTGEVLDIDAITGGFNFQSAWTTAWILSENVGKS